jgi:dihydropteroate synthase
MILVRSFPSVEQADRRWLEQRSGRPITFARCLLVTGLSAADAAAYGGAGDAAVFESASDLPAALLRTPTPAPLELNGRVYRFDDRPWILGVVNVTPDSFSDGGEHLSTTAAVEHGLRLLEEGADWLDVGGESTRPGAPPVSSSEELARVLPVIEGLAKHAPLSIDTSKPEVADAALQAGAVLVNDVSAFSDPRMGELVGRRKAAACLMHMRGTPRTMQLDPRYRDVVQDVADELEHAVQRAVEAGVPRARLLVDPGIGFGKTVEHNWHLLRHLGSFRRLGCAVMLGTSRKSFLGKLTGREPKDRVMASAATAAIAGFLGAAQVLRVHDAAATRDAVLVAHAWRTARESGDR